METRRSTRAKRAFFVLAILVAGIGVCAARYLWAAHFAVIYPHDKSVFVSHSIEPDFFFIVQSGEAITVTVAITNSEEVALRGFYYSDQVPNGWAVDTTGVTVNGSFVGDYVYRQGYPDQVYTGFTPHRWALEIPQGDGAFSPTHPISASIGTAQITYTMIVSGGMGTDYTIGYEAWTGWLETDSPGTAVFGYLGITQTMQAGFAADPHNGVIPLTVQFTDTTSGGPTAWAWDFGDGTTVSSQQHPTHTYVTTGTHTVTLTVNRARPAHSDTVVRFDFITVTLPPLQADFRAHPPIGLPPLTVQFTDLSIGNILTRAWDFGDGITGSLPNPTHTFNALGCYTVSLTVQDVHREDNFVRPRYIHVTEQVYDVYLPTAMRN